MTTRSTSSLPDWMHGRRAAFPGSDLGCSDGTGEVGSDRQLAGDALVRGLIPESRPSARSLARTVATMRSQRSPAKPKMSTAAVSMSRWSASRSIARARNSRVRTVAGGSDRQSAVSWTVMSSTSRITNTARNATGQLVDSALEDPANLGAQGGGGRRFRALICDRPRRQTHCRTSTSSRRGRRRVRASVCAAASAPD